MTDIEPVDAQGALTLRALVAELLDRLEAAEAQRRAASQTYADLHDDWERQIDRAEKAEAEVASLRERLAKVKRYSSRCAIMRVEPSSAGLRAALTEGGAR